MSESNHKSNINKAAGATALSLMLNIFAQGMVQAQPTNEVFNAVPQDRGAISKPKAFTAAPANPVAAPGAMDMAGAGGTPETRWFEKMDSIVFSGFPTAYEKSILSRQFNQEAERVQEWIMTAQKVAGRYRKTAKALRDLPVPENWEAIAQYRDVRSDWFDDAATIYEDMYKPRKPARTIEELTAQLDDVKSRAEQLGETKKINREMDRKLRVHYRIHAPKETDALTIYVTGKSK
jgi:hypothetical protein